MKFVTIPLLLIGVIFCTYSTSAPTTTDNPLALYEKYLKELPIAEVRNITLSHLANDVGLKAAIKYLKSDAWIQLIENLRKQKNWIEYKEYLKQAGININEIVDQFEHCFGKLNETIFADVDVKQANVSSYVQDLKNTLLVPILKLIADSKHSAQPTEIVQASEFLHSEKNKQMLEKVLTSKEIEAVFSALKKIGLNVDEFLAFIYTMLGLN